MKTLFQTIILVVILLGCGSSSPMGVKGKDNFIPIARGIITLNKGEDLVGKTISLIISSAYATTSSAVVSYIQAENASITLDISGITPEASPDGNTLNIGNIVVSNLKANKLKICGLSGNQKCSVAVIRAFTLPTPSFESVNGLINTTDGYGSELLIENMVLENDTPIVLSTFNIPVNKNKIDESNFSNVDYSLISDFSNAGFGNYTATIVIELALGE
jgi:hypothetical protein